MVGLGDGMPIFRGQPDLLRRFRLGDRQVLELVYRTYVGKVTNVVRFGFKLSGGALVVPGLAGRANDVADIVQEVFTKCFARAARESFDGQRDYGPYLFAATRNVMVDRLRAGARELPTPWDRLVREQEAEMIQSDSAPAWADDQTIALVARYLADLDEELKRVHRARYVEGLSQRDAAAQLGIGRQTLRTLEERLRAGLRTELERSDADASRASSGGR